MLCECGCGGEVPIAKVTRRGYRAGEPMRFIWGHNTRKQRTTVTWAKCCTCKHNLVAEEFYTNPRTWNGLSPRCKNCARKQAREQHKANRSKILQYQANYRSRPGRRERQRKLRTQWEQLDPWRTQQGKRDRQATRRARQVDQFDEHVDGVVVFERDRGVCGICGEVIDPSYFDLDHVIPLAKGGRHSYANIQLAHPLCNIRKGVRLI